MLTKTPFLTGFSTLLCGSAKRRKQDVLAAERGMIVERCPDALSRQFRDEISADLLAEHSTTKRDRTYPDAVTFWAFFGQVLSEDGSCARAVARVQEWCSASSMPVPSASSASFVTARKALPVEMLQAVNRSLCDQLDRELPAAGLWRGLRVKAEDGTSAQMPDTPANQEAYPQPSGQEEGCGFPVIGLSGLIDLGHGGLRDFAGSSVETGEMRGHDQLEGYLGEGDLHVGDRAFSSYEVVARDKMMGVEYIGRNHQARKLDFRRGSKLGPDERVQTWVKPRQQPALSRLGKGEWDALPGEIEPSPRGWRRLWRARAGFMLPCNCSKCLIACTGRLLSFASSTGCPSSTSTGAGRRQTGRGGAQESGGGDRAATGRRPVAALHRPDHRREFRADLSAGGRLSISR